MINSIRILLFLPLFFSVTSLTTKTVADDGEQLDALYRTFLSERIDTEAVADSYSGSIIHVSRPGLPFLKGKSLFLETNIAPLAQMLNAGQAKLKMRFLVVQRTIGPTLANDVGYIHSLLTLPDGSVSESVHKYSWVMQKSDGQWQILTDFDGVEAPKTVLDETFVRVIE